MIKGYWIDLIKKYRKRVPSMDPCIGWESFKEPTFS